MITTSRKNGNALEITKTCRIYRFIECNFNCVVLITARRFKFWRYFRDFWKKNALRLNEDIIKTFDNRNPDFVNAGLLVTLWQYFKRNCIITAFGIIISTDSLKPTEFVF